MIGDREELAGHMRKFVSNVDRKYPTETNIQNRC